MKKFMITMFAFATICLVSCEKENVNPTNNLVKKTIMKSGGGDKRPSGTYD